MTASNPRPLDNFISLLTGVVADGDKSWKAYCPIHEGDGGQHTPSLQVTEAGDGKILVYCHVCKDKEIGPKICNKFGISIRALFPDWGLPENVRGRGRRRRIEGRKTAEYEYRDIDGGVAFKVMRYETGDGQKTFVQARPNGQGGWIYNMRGVRRILYRLPELVSADKSVPVFVVEGEKKVEALMKWGQVATCNVGGAGKWNREYSTHFRGRTVIVLPDNDPPNPENGRRAGQDHAATVFKSSKDLAAAVRIIDLPGLPEKGDIVDWQADGHTLAELLELVRVSLEGPAPDVDGVPDDDSAESLQERDPHSPLYDEGRTDIANGKRLAEAKFGEVLYCQPMDKWLIWTGRRWKFDQKCRMEFIAKENARRLWDQVRGSAAGNNGKDISRTLFEKMLSFCKYSSSRNGILNCIRMASSEEGMQVLPGKLDPNPWLLNCRNGVVNLQNGELLPHDKDDYITKLAPVEFDPEATCPTWDRFVSSVFGGDLEMVGYVQRLCGYWATGVVREQMLPILWGGGSNGKTTFLNVIMDVLGRDYSMKAAQEFLMQKKGDAHPTEKADLFGKRFVACSETEEGRRLSESLVKEMTGTERIRARRMREDFWEFDATHKVVLVTNHKPVVSGGDHGIWRRIRLIPFEQQFWNPDTGESGPPELMQDKELPDKLRTEYSGILTWIVRGCVQWREFGEQIPAAIRHQTAEYRSSQDVIGQWIEECCELSSNASTQSSSLYKSFVQWCEKNHEFPMSNRRFATNLADRGFKKYRSNGSWYQGIATIGFIPDDGFRLS